MPRKTRMYLPGVLAHIVQRGNNREACFFCDEDYQFYKEVLLEGLKRYGAALHAYCLMTNHVHLLITPNEAGSISRIIQHVGRQYVQYINKTYRRTGTLWEGCHKGSLVDAENYLLTCYRYIELTPVAANMVESPDEYRWSSYRANAWGEDDDLITPHELYLRIGRCEDDSQCKYRDLFRVMISNQDVHQIKQALSKNYPTGSTRFKEQVEAMFGRKVGSGVRGRPRLN
jgi:REP-associated tyrosine transposase